MDEHIFSVGDEVTINATVIHVTASGNPIVKLKGGYKFLIKPSDINTIHPFSEIPKEDMRKGN